MSTRELRKSARGPRPRIRRQAVSVVTGGAGFLGSHLADLLLARGHKVIGIDNLVTGTVENIAHLARAIRTSSSSSRT